MAVFESYDVWVRRNPLGEWGFCKVTGGE